MFINIYISSKNFSSIKNFINFLNVLSLSKPLKNKLFLKYLKIPSSKKVFTLLKSPHVNKTAQDQFEFWLTITFALLLDEEVAGSEFRWGAAALEPFPMLARLLGCDLLASRSWDVAVALT